MNEMLLAKEHKLSRQVALDILLILVWII